MTGIGPQLPTNVAKKVVGPQMPSHLLNQSLKAEDEKDEQREIGPAPPTRKKVAGPQLPSHLLNRHSNAHDEDDEQEYGPAIPVAMKDLSEKDLEFYKQKELEVISEKDLLKKNITVQKREDWMIKPPEPKRAALSQKTVFSKKGVEEVDSAIWTASPADREQVLKKRKRADQSSQITKKDQIAKEIVAEHNLKHRSTSLLDQHQKRTRDQAEEEDPLSYKRFDRERDIVNRQLDTKKRDSMIQEAKTLSSKFSSGKFL